MAQLIDIKKVEVGPRNLVATVEVAPNAPLYTSEDPEGTELVLGLLPELENHVCLGDASGRFGEVVAQTEIAHLLEHVTVELLARTDIAGDITCGQTVEVANRTYEITFACPDDVLVAGCLSSAVWILQWAYSGGVGAEPNIDGTVAGLVGLVDNLTAAENAAAEEQAAEAADMPAEDAFDATAAWGVATVDEAASSSDSAQSRWDMEDMPRPRLVR